MQGFFDDKNKKYVIKDMKPRRPWLNYLWNDRTVCQCDQFGRSAGCHIYTDSDDVLYAGKNFICIHASTDGEKKIKLNCQNHVRCMSYMKNVTILTILPMLHLIWNAEKHLLPRYVNKI